MVEPKSSYPTFSGLELRGWGLYVLEYLNWVYNKLVALYELTTHDPTSC